MKRRIRTHLDQVQPKVVEHVEDKQFQQQKAHDQHAKERIIKAGDDVFVRDFRKRKAWQKGIVLKLTGPVSAQVQLDNGQTVRRHLDHIRKCYLKPQNEDDDIMMPSIEEPPVCQQTVDPPEQPDLVPPTENCPALRQLPTRQRRVPQHLSDYELEN